MKPSSLIPVINHLLDQQRAMFLWGPPGVGKSDLVAQIAEDRKVELRDVRMSLLDPIDLKGFPMPNTVKKEMNWLPADFLPKDKKSKGILFLDEMNGAPQSVQAAGYQLILNRRIGDYHLPPGWSIAAAGNRTSDRSVVHAQPAALANRFIHLDFEVSPDDWDLWAMRNNMHTDLRAFMRFRPHLLHDFRPETSPRAFPSPRSWAFVNQIYKSGMSVNDEFETIKGTVGEAGSGEFMAFTRLIKDLPTVDQVLLDPLKTKVPDSPAGKFAIATALEAKTTAINFGRILSYIEKMDVEFQVVYVRGAVRVCDAAAKTKEYMNWGLKNQNVLT